QTQVSAFDINELDEVYGGELVNLVRKEVGLWRVARYPNVTRVTNDLLRFWFLNDERLVTQNLFFAQQEALEIAIWLNEVAYKSNAGQFILDQLHKSHQSVSDDINAQLPRIAFKMATGTGKTVVMGALIIYHYLNRQEYRN